jgi:phospholipase A1
MDQRQGQKGNGFRLAQGARLALAACCIPAAALAQAPATGLPPAPIASAELTWQRCAALSTDNNARLACFDRWAQQQTLPAQAVPPAPAALASQEPAKPVDPLVPATRVVEVAMEEGCKDPQYSDLSRFWELEVGSSCDTFQIRGYRPITFSLIGANNVNQMPTSGNPANNATTSQPYRTSETRLQLSVRTKIASGLLTRGHPTLRDSIWVGYSQQSYWQLFNSSISRPFRNTDHEPEILYVYPTDYQLPFGWRVRYTGAGLVHQSNGQSLPLSRSWNRVYLMTGAELDNKFRLQARVWKRVPDRNGQDDNPEISDYIGRAEVMGSWNVNRNNMLTATVRSSLASSDRGSVRLEWIRALATDGGLKLPNGLRLHTQLFSGYGDSLLDYNYRRTVLSVGLSLVDF